MDQSLLTRPDRRELSAPPVTHRRGGWVRGRVHLVVPALLTAGLAFRSGGFFPGVVGLAAAALAVLALLRLTLAERPFAGWSASASVVALAGAALASWTLLSAAWSDSVGRALPEFDRTLVLVLTFVLFASIPRGPRDLSVLLRWVLVAIVAVAAVGVASRLLPEVISITPGQQPVRLAYPLTYWNAMGVICALGFIMAVHAASGGQEPPLVRALAGAVLPLLAVGIYFTFSRGGIATAVVGAVLYAILAHPRRLALTLVTAVPAAGVAVWVAYGAGALAQAAYARGAGPAEGQRVAWVLAACMLGAFLARLALAPVERRLARRRLEPGRRRRLLAGAAACAVVAVAIAAVAVDLPDRVSRQYHAFLQRDVADTGDARDRLGALSNNGRLVIWRVDTAAFSAHPVRGNGAGTFHLQWDRRRGPLDGQVLDGHSLYLETLAELGIVGGVLLVVMLAGLLAGPLRRLRDADRHAQAAVLAAGVALVLHAGIDWDWEMPALFAWLFAAGGVACARPAAAVDARPARRAAAVSGWVAPGRLVRVVGGLACLLLALGPLQMYRSQGALERAVAAFSRGDCAAAVDASLDSISALPARAEPYEPLGYCDLRLGNVALGTRAMQNARERDPGVWQYAYGVAVALAFSRAADAPAMAREAVRLGPQEPLARHLLTALRHSRPARWPRVAARARIPAT